RVHSVDAGAAIAPVARTKTIAAVIPPTMTPSCRCVDCPRVSPAIATHLPCSAEERRRVSTRRTSPFTWSLRLIAPYTLTEFQQSLSFLTLERAPRRLFSALVRNSCNQSASDSRLAPLAWCDRRHAAGRLTATPLALKGALAGPEPFEGGG